MRAFMSTDGKRRFLVPASTNDERAAAAVRETRRILAETEPIRDGFSLADRLYRGPFLRVEPFDAERALADALAGFIGQTFAGEPCRCVQGHHWSPERGYFECNGVAP